MPDYTGPLKEFERTVSRMAGEEAKREITEGIEEITNTSKPEEVALWVKNAMEKMDNALNEETKMKIMTSLGHNCAEINKRPIMTAVKRRNKYDSLDDFLEAEEKRPPKGTRLEREGNTLHYYYTPSSYGPGLRCYCSLFRGLPEGETAPITYCNCSKGFVEKYWQTILGEEVNVELIQSTISGAKECKFTIHLNPS